jgi:CDP-diacylglycerol--glycerol-3-phosphate 3-phosphatidyltransferase
MVRLLLIPVFIAFIVSYTREQPILRYAALVVYGIAAISDALDGFVARAYNQKTKLGALLDPLADKLMVNIGFVFIAVNDQFACRVPYWFPVVLLARDAMIVMGAYIINEFYGPIRVKPRISGKVTTAFQMSLMIAVLIEASFTRKLLFATVIMCAVSYVDYMYTGIRQIGNEDEA